MNRSGSVKPHYHSSGNNYHSNNRQYQSNYNSNSHYSSHTSHQYGNSPSHRASFNAATSNQRESNIKTHSSQNGNNYTSNHNTHNYARQTSYNNSKSNYNSNSSGNKSSYGGSNKPNYNSETQNPSHYNNHYTTNQKSGYNSYGKANYKSDETKSQSNRNDNYSQSHKQKNHGNQSNSSTNNIQKDSNYVDPRYPSNKSLNDSSQKSVNFNKNSQNSVLNDPRYPMNNSINNFSQKSMDSNDHRYSQNKFHQNSVFESKKDNTKVSDNIYSGSKSGVNHKSKDSLDKSQSNNENFNSKSTGFNKSSYHNQNKKFGSHPDPNIKTKSNANHSRFNSVQPLQINPQTQDGRKEIAKKTLDIIKSGQYNTSKGTVNIKKDIDDCVKKTKTIDPKHYSKDWKPQSKQPGKMCQFEVLPESSFGAARKLVKDNKKTCVLNFASATKPGGGFINGKQAQEESLSRQSALYKSLESQKEMYDKHKKINDNYYTDYMIYSPEVPVFRNDKDESLLPESFKASVITSAAPNKTKIDEEKYSPSSAKKKQELGTLIKDRCRKIVQCAIDEKNEALVLGAYGCGVFGNDPKEVSRAFKEVLVDEGYGKYFDKVVFAIPGQHSNNFRVFSSEFPPSSE